MAVAVRDEQPAGVEDGRLTDAVAKARSALLADQGLDGHWCNELEADCTIPAEYVLFLRYLGESPPELEAKIGRYLRARQAEHGGWSDPEFTAPGFPRVFYLRYHGYSMFFPLWALARYRNHVTAR